MGIGGTFKICGTKPKLVPPILNVPPIHGYIFTGEETGHRAGGLTCEKQFVMNRESEI